MEWDHDRTTAAWVLVHPVTPGLVVEEKPMIEENPLHFAWTKWTETSHATMTRSSRVLPASFPRLTRRAASK